MFTLKAEEDLSIPSSSNQCLAVFQLMLFYLSWLVRTRQLIPLQLNNSTTNLKRDYKVLEGVRGLEL